MTGRGFGRGLLATTVALTAINLRPAAASIGPVLRDLQADLAMSDAAAGVLTAAPLVTFGVVGLVGGRLAARLGAERALAVGAGLLLIGLVARVLVGSVAAFLLATTVALLGGAAANVLLPVVVRRWFPDRVGPMTGVYSMALTAGTAIASATTVPLAEVTGGWRGGLGAWALPAAAAALLWIVAPTAAPRRPRAAARGTGSTDQDTTGCTDGAADAAGGSTGGGLDVRREVVRDRRTWCLAVFFGIQAIEAYVVIGWLPTILQDAGVSPARAGVLVSLAMLLPAPASLLMPRLVRRRPDTRRLTAGLVVAPAAAYLGLLLAPGAAPLLWVVLCGIGMCTFPLALVLIGVRASTDVGTAALSSIVQGVGFLIGAAGPVAFGVLHELTGAWDLPLALLLGLLVPKLVVGLVAGPPGAIDLPPVAPPPP